MSLLGLAPEPALSPDLYSCSKFGSPEWSSKVSSVPELFFTQPFTQSMCPNSELVRNDANVMLKLL